jgi:hypothetical protein
MTLRRNTQPPSSGLKKKLRKKPVALLTTCFHAGFLFGLFFDNEDGGYMFLQNIG